MVEVHNYKKTAFITIVFILFYCIQSVSSWYVQPTHTDALGFH